MASGVLAGASLFSSQGRMRRCGGRGAHLSVGELHARYSGARRPGEESRRSQRENRGRRAGWIDSAPGQRVQPRVSGWIRLAIGAYLVAQVVKAERSRSPISCRIKERSDPA